MPELYKGYIPFSYGNPENEEKKYVDEVGNDYDPTGWNTASAMKIGEGEVTDSSGKKYKIAKKKVNNYYNIPPFEEGVWNGITDSEGGGGNAAPVIKELDVIPNTFIISDKGAESDYKITVKTQEGVDPISEIKIDIIVDDVTKETKTYENPTETEETITIKKETMNDYINDGAKKIEIKIVVTDGKRTTEDSKIIYVGEQIIFGEFNTYNAADINKLKEFIEDSISSKSEYVRLKAVDYNIKNFNVKFNCKDTHEYVFLAIPSDYGLVSKFTSDGIIYLIDETNATDFKLDKNIEINETKYNIYRLLYNNSSSFEFNVEMDEV